MSLHIDAMVIGTRSAAATIAVYGQGPYAQAVAALVGMRGHKVGLLGQSPARTVKCDIWTDANAHYTTACAFHQAPPLASLKSAEAVILAVPATAYGDAFEEVGHHLVSGQTIFIFGAAFGAALEAERILSRRRDLAISIVEISRPFAEVEEDKGCLRVTGARETLMLAGRSLNETRSGLSTGAAIFNGVVPASTIFERAFFDMDKWLDTSALLFTALGTERSTAGLIGVLAALRTELQLLARAYGMHRVPEPSCNRPIKARPNVMAQLADCVAEDFVILSNLARLKHMSVPILDAVIELSGAATGIDLHREGRQLSDLGLIGMDAQEIIEYVSA